MSQGKRALIRLSSEGYLVANHAAVHDGCWLLIQASYGCSALLRVTHCSCPVQSAEDKDGNTLVRCQSRLSRNQLCWHAPILDCARLHGRSQLIVPNLVLLIRNTQLSAQLPGQQKLALHLKVQKPLLTDKLVVLPSLQAPYFHGHSGLHTKSTAGCYERTGVKRMLVFLLGHVGASWHYKKPHSVMSCPRLQAGCINRWSTSCSEGTSPWGCGFRWPVPCEPGPGACLAAIASVARLGALQKQRECWVLVCI
ncbi:hypothetical protein V8C86DRAFT_29014 [Haematococcus lacustris]